MDYVLGRKCNLYALSWLENVRACIGRKIPFYYAGQGSEKTKSHLGATLIPSFILFKHRQPVIDRLLMAWPAVNNKVLSHIRFWPAGSPRAASDAPISMPSPYRGGMEIHDQGS
jgi:hypothetical protein